MCINISARYALNALILFNLQKSLEKLTFKTLSRASHLIYSSALFDLLNNTLYCVYFQADPSQLEARLDNGLVMGHAYSVTNVKLVSPSGTGTA